VIGARYAQLHVGAFLLCSSAVFKLSIFSRIMPVTLDFGGCLGLLGYVDKMEWTMICYMFLAGQTDLKRPP
jgi:hypothetical protein